MSEFNIDDFRVSAAPHLLKPNLAKPQRIPQHVRYASGPLWLSVLNRFRLPIAFRVYVALQTRKHMGYSPRLARGFFEAFGLSKRDAQRGLRQLEIRGLARVTSRPGCAAEVELVIPEDAARGTNRPLEEHDVS